MNQLDISWNEIARVQDFASDKFCYVGDEETREQAISDFVQCYIDGGKFAVFNDRNQFLDYFDTLDDAIYYKERNEPKNELWSIEIEF